ncbi:sulfotransferase family 2 domain-containing protein [Alkalilimnicola ehrlichii]
MRTPFHRRYPSPSANVAHEVDKRIAVDRQQGFIYFRIPKAANSTICATLYPKSNRNSVDKRTAKRYFARGRSLTADEIKHLASRFFLFSFVRNPYTRTASAYLDKVKRNTKTQNLIRQRLKLPGEEPVSFLTFFQYLTAGGLYDNAHWYPQTTFIPCGTKTLSFWVEWKISTKI